MKKRIVLIAFICLMIDQITKFLITSNFDVGTGKTIIPSFFSIAYIRNTGAAWGLFSNGTIFLAILSIFFLIFAIKYIIELNDVTILSMYAYGLLLGGIVGNLIDRLVRKFVVDFLSFNIISYNFPVFNIADCFIVISIVLLIIETFIKDRKKNAYDNK